MSHRNLKLCLAVLLIAAVACSTSAPAPTGTPTPDLAATAQAVEAAEARVTAEAVETQDAQATATAAFGLTATPARATEVAAQRQATRQAATAQAIVEATAQAQPMVEAIQKLVDDGYLDRSEGKYFALRDFYESWAQLNWYTYQDTGYAPTNFVVRADWWNSGCGFVFREQDVDNHYLAYLGLDGWVYFSAFRNGSFVDLGGARYGKVGVPSGGAQLTLIVDGNKFTFFVNGERVYSKVDQAFASGRLALTLLSGTNKDYGTRCLMKNVELWELK